MNTEKMSFEWRFLLQWVMVSTLGFAIGFPMGRAMGGAEVFGVEIQFVTVGLAIGFFVGIMQWLVLWRQISRSGCWVLASTLGGAVGIVVGLIMLIVVATIIGFDLEANTDEFSSGAFAGFVAIWFGGIGFSIGTMQWLILRRQISQAGYWVLASFMGWAALGAVAALMGLDLEAVGEPIGKVVRIGAVSGAVLGAITGFPMVWLLQQDVSGT
ncbi:MAG: hypothetical protein SWK90_06255 [Chloroflexota bacterium]|nr:hypothetical protein [Chloroflexota bacterium]